MANLSDFDTDTDEEVYTMILMTLASTEKKKIPCRTSKLQGHDWVRELLEGNPTRIYESLRMDKRTFRIFCEDLKQHGGLKATKNIGVEEQVAIFLKIVGTVYTTREGAERFQHSTATISKYFGIVLKAVNRFASTIISHPNLNEVPPHILGNSKFYPYFKVDCVGAIDGVQIDACIPVDDQIPYRGRKATTTQNVMCVCFFDMLFTYVMAGWEGTANDARILLETASNNDNQFPMPPQGKYYVVDSGYPNLPGFLAPYRHVTSHFQEIRRRGGPRGRDELFNFRHSSLRNVIERCFGVLKARFPILKFMRSYSFKKQTRIVIACCAIHNFIKIHAEGDPLLEEFGNYEDEDHILEEPVAAIQYDNSSARAREMAERREEIANKMWADYQI
ncbi:Putative nuclease HARBI1 [Linum grandiflorum]